MATQHHAQVDGKMLQERVAVYERARQGNPLLWSTRARDWHFIDAGHRNPDSAQTKGLFTESSG